MSVSNYVAAKIKGEDDKKFSQLLASVPERCNHTSRICPTMKCVESWAIDWQIHFDRTATGRTMAATLGLDADMIRQLANNETIGDSPLENRNRR